MASSAVLRIAMSPHAADSGLRTSVRNDADLTAALFDTVSYESIEGTDDIEVRELAVGAVMYLFYDAPSDAVEMIMIDRYWGETAVEVRVALVDTLCEHQYSSKETIDVLDHAGQDNDPGLATRAQACLESITAIAGAELGL